MAKLLIISIAVAVLVGCASGPGSVWKAVESQDQFTDEVTKMVTVGEWKNTSLLVTKSFNYYPFVGMHNGEIYVGLRSGGRHRIPTGTVQIRVDNNKAWTIGPEETPLFLVPSLPKTPMVAPGMTELVEQATAQAMANAAKIMSPYTAATGDKAKSIIKEMLGGKVVKYRTVGLNQAASTTGEVIIDESFVQSLRQIGIRKESL